MSFSGRLAVRLVADREGEVIGGEGLRFGVHFRSAIAADVDVFSEVRQGLRQRDKWLRSAS